MNRKRGRMDWFPKPLVEETESVMQDRGLSKNQAKIEIVKYCRVGREVEKMKDRMTLQDIFKRKRR